MKNVSSLKTTKTESPKTPGGISKSLLTPCRRVGLSRNWKKVGPSPFISPLSSSAPSSVEVKVEKKEPRKRKLRAESEEISEVAEDATVFKDCPENSDLGEIPSHKTNDLTSTPTRHFEIPRKKKSKTLLSALNTAKTIVKDSIPEKLSSENTVAESSTNEDLNVNNPEETDESVSVPVKKSKSKNKNASLKTPRTLNSALINVERDNFEKEDICHDKINAGGEENKIESTNIIKNKKAMSPKTTPNVTNKCDIANTKNITDNIEKKDKINTLENKPKSPNELTKECIVVIQKKLFKSDGKESKKLKEKSLKSQVLFDSDSDDVPLCNLNKENKTHNEIQEKTDVPEVINVDEEDDFMETKKSKVKKLEDKSTSISGLKKPPKLSIKNKKSTMVPSTPLTNETGFDDEDDFDFSNRKTILIRQTYEKVNKPQKAKSTGSITQRDIDEIKARIEAKKKLILARAMTEDTVELRNLIKKWQKGCQNALIELMDLMKDKFPDKQNMEYSEMLAMLKIPSHLVGYDENNDCFTTPEDKDIILANFRDV